MRKTLLALGVLFIYGIGSGELLACGDKFLVASRGTRYQRAGQSRVRRRRFSSTSTPRPRSRKRSRRFRMRRVREGRLSRDSVANHERARSGAAPGRLGSGPDRPCRQCQTVRGRVQGAGGPMVVPVAYGVTGTQLAQAKKDYQRVLKGPIKTYAFLAAH